MSDIAIRVEHLSKRYKLGQREPYKNLREVISSAARAPLGWLKPTVSNASQDAGYLWALDDVSFEIKQGEAVGIIGRNGAGKSTLLKILSRITKPTRGQAEIFGRVGSLLEVGTGFHPELTGRENIYLNGAILGMRRAEIAKKFDEIVDFAEIEKFLDTPVKRYSSGMYVRLAFAVAAHLEPEILLVDEVLAVGDAAFQKKCLGKMGEVAGQGRTVIFVSHNLNAITRLCQKTLWLQNGNIQMLGDAYDVTNKYQQVELRIPAIRKWPIVEHEKAPGDDIVQLKKARICNKFNHTVETVDVCDSFFIEVTYYVREEGHILVPNLHFFNDSGTNLFISIDIDPSWRNRSRPIGTYVSKAHIPANFLSEGRIIVGVAITTFNPFNVHFYEKDVISCLVVDSLNSESARGDFVGHLPGVVRPMMEWNTEYYSI
jgi:lipopolysaccharide transport system ATP-binding protein